jgi:hypothetical protein
MKKSEYWHGAITLFGYNYLIGKIKSEKCNFMI